MANMEPELLQLKGNAPSEFYHQLMRVAEKELSSKEFEHISTI